MNLPNLDTLVYVTPEWDAMIELKARRSLMPNKGTSEWMWVYEDGTYDNPLSIISWRPIDG